jgi:hypothetical protein
MLALLELSGRSTLFTGQRPFMLSLVTFLKKISAFPGFIGEFAEGILRSLLVHVISIEDCTEIEHSFACRQCYAINGQIFSFCSNDGDSRIAITVRGSYGVSSLSVYKRVSFKSSEPENNLKPSILRRSQIELDNLPPFPPFPPSPPPSTRSTALSFLSSIGLLLTDAPSIPLSLPITPRFLEALEQFDRSCVLPEFPISVVQVSPGAISYDNANHNSPRFQQFLADLGTTFSMTSCRFRFEVALQPVHRILIIFNESGFRVCREFSEHSCVRLAIVIEPVDSGMSKPVHMYRLTILKVAEAYYIPPFAIHKTRILPVKSLAKTVASCLYFLVAQCGSDKETELFKCELAAKILEQTVQRRENLTAILREFSVVKDAVETALE